MTGAPRPITIAILAMGGEGGGVLADWLIDAAEHGAHLAQLTSIPGVAQRTGATIYYLELFAEKDAKGRDPVLSLMPAPGDVDLVVASELMEAGRAIERGLVTPDRTTLIASTHRVYAMTEKIALEDGRVDSGRLVEACGLAARRFIGADMAALADATGSVISAVLLGAIAGAEVLPFPRAAFEAAVRRSGVSVKASLAAFATGFDAARADAAPAPRPAVRAPETSGDPFAAEIATFPASARDLVRAGVERLIDYQDLDYARRYLDLLGPVAEAGRRHGDGSGRMVAETARELALGMSYEDTIRVAELKIRPDRFRRVREDVRAADGQIVEIAEFLHPRVEEIADTLPAASGRWLLRTAWARRLVERFTRSGKVVKTTSVGGFLLLYGVARLKRFRRRSLRFATETDSLDGWLATVTGLAATNYLLAAEVAEARTLVKGYGDTHQRGQTRFAQLMGLVPALAVEREGAVIFARLRKAALADEEGVALERALAEMKIGSGAAASELKQAM